MPAGSCSFLSSTAPPAMQLGSHDTPLAAEAGNSSDRQDDDGRQGDDDDDDDSHAQQLRPSSASRRSCSARTTAFAWFDDTNTIEGSFKCRMLTKAQPAGRSWCARTSPRTRSSKTARSHTTASIKIQDLAPGHAPGQLDIDETTQPRSSWCWASSSTWAS